MRLEKAGVKTVQVNRLTLVGQSLQGEPFQSDKGLRFFGDSFGGKRFQWDNNRAVLGFSCQVSDVRQLKREILKPEY